MSDQVIASWGWAIYDTACFAAEQASAVCASDHAMCCPRGWGIAFYSIHVTSTIARRRATIDFFLKAEADSSIVKLFQAFDDHVEAVSKQINGGKALEDVVKSDEYKTVHRATGQAPRRPGRRSPLICRKSRWHKGGGRASSTCSIPQDLLPARIGAAACAGGRAVFPRTRSMPSHRDACECRAKRV